MTDENLNAMIQDAFYSFGFITALARCVITNKDTLESVNLRLAEIEELLFRGSEALRAQVLLERQKAFLVKAPDIMGPCGSWTPGTTQQWEDTV